MRPRQQTAERTSFQEHGPYDPAVDSKADVAMVYGLDPTFEPRVEGWRRAGYRIAVMTGVAWGDYADYVRGQWDGQKHFDDAQTEIGNFKLEHGISQGHDIYYMIPSVPYTNYLAGKLRRVVDAGAVAIHLEEPEFWIRAGYGAGFEREWLEFYGEPWQDPLSSPDARYRASKLMQHLYTRALTSLFAGLKQYAREKNVPEFACYVPTHSLINYSHWRIISPESKLLAIPDCDGIIGQVWTGTSRTPTMYRGTLRQRTFEAGYCEYAACAGMVRGSGKRLWQLADPIEDNPNYCWEDYRFNWECTVAASLLVPESEYFEIMPWPRRIFLRDYPTVNLDTLPVQPLLDSYFKRLQEKGETELEAVTRRAVDLYMEYYNDQEEKGIRETIGYAKMDSRSIEMRFGDLWGSIQGFYKHLNDWEDQADAQRLRDALSALYHNAAPQRAYIPPGYATELQTVFNALADMSWPGETEWISGTPGVGLAVADSLMYQRAMPAASDEDLSSFYGLSMPLVKNGVPVSMVQLERAHELGYLDPLKVIFLTYEGQKPPSAQAHTALVDWVKRGNALVICGSGDAYNEIREWWTQSGYNSPQQHLCELAGLGRAPAAGRHACGQGWVFIKPASPNKLAHDPHGADEVLSTLKSACGAVGIDFQPTHILALRRGPYVVAASMDEGESDAPFELSGVWINLFDPEMRVLQNPVLEPNTRWLLYDLTRSPQTPWVIASAGRVQDEAFTDHALTFTVDGMANTRCCLRTALPAQPVKVSAGELAVESEWDEKTRTLLVKFDNQCDGVKVEIGW